MFSFCIGVEVTETQCALQTDRLPLYVILTLYLPHDMYGWCQFVIIIIIIVIIIIIIVIIILLIGAFISIFPNQLEAPHC